MQTSFILLSKYNTEMNIRVHQAAQKLSSEELGRERGAFFGSILGTMNHLIVGDSIWLHRISAHPSHFSSLQKMNQWDKPSALNQVLVTDLASWSHRRRALDQIIGEFVLEVRPADLSSSLDYLSTEGIANRKPLTNILLHFFNHQTHHRGQISTMLFQAGVDVGVTDLLSFVPNEAAN